MPPLKLSPLLGTRFLEALPDNVERNIYRGGDCTMTKRVRWEHWIPSIGVPISIQIDFMSQRQPPIRDTCAIVDAPWPRWSLGWCRTPGRRHEVLGFHPPYIRPCADRGRHHGKDYSTWHRRQTQRKEDWSIPQRLTAAPVTGDKHPAKKNARLAEG